MINTDSTKIDQLLNRGVENIYPNREFLIKLLISGKRLTLYTGYDPTAPTLHIGHAITLLKLRDFQELGHRVIMLIGDFTGMIGDPTDKSATRQQLTRQQVMANCKKYKKQASHILDFNGSNKAELKYNSKWLAKMNFSDVLKLASHLTIQRILERDMFARRMPATYARCRECKNLFRSPIQFGTKEAFDAAKLTNNTTTCPFCKKITSIENKDLIFQPENKVYSHELLYPLMQGYDSVAMDVDGEIGGNDQEFNMLVGRTLMKDLKNKEKFVLTTKLLTDSGGRKMGKSEGNMVALSASAQDMFGGIMSWSDELIISGFMLCTRLPEEEIKKMEQDLKSGVNPRDQKARLAFEITKMYHGEAVAQKAQEEFDNIFQKNKNPNNIPSHKLENPGTDYTIPDLLQEIGVQEFPGEDLSRSGTIRLMEEGAIKINNITEKDWRKKINFKNGDIVKVGKRRFFKLG